ncbi:efflux RND transporter permease subunit [Brevibacillus centrosporus]|uniref:efflux RND transporter permease subunit n=1 Tax=Brevibacillus centrosporus TaxID=54910 RepID=UPI000F0A16D7|nr:efflux RND transporter permease subunit [Brevibacillus centrosporus]MEC2128094.1 efflux RND transporter permease subunit [Brevibacillus centrosporus]RNB63064.1 efflux RND transporter permease subunit [Brevibacillus centrosporus]GED34684.1 transporter [Brevibacillus centrosporus]
MSNRSFVSSVPALARLLAVACCLLGVGAFLRMDVTTFPERPVPVYTIHLAAPGLTSEKIDEKVTRPIEESVRAVGDALTITAESRPGASSVTVETSEKLGSDYKERLEKRLGEVAKQLPVTEWSISQDNLADNRVGFYVLHGNDVQTLSDIARYTVYENLIRLPGVARVEIDDRSAKQQVDLIFRPSMLLAYGLTPKDVLDQLPGDVVNEQVGSVGQNKDQSAFYWTSMSEGPQGLGKQLIATDRGYVTLKTLADIRDLRGSKGDEVSVYRGSPAIGITLLAADVGQVPSIREQAADVIESLNKAAGDKYRIDLFDDYAQPLSGAINQLTLLAAAAAIACALFLYLAHKRMAVSLLLLFSVVMATGFTLGGMWLSGVPLSYSTVGPVAIFALLFTGAGSALLHRMHCQKADSFLGGLRIAGKLMKPLLLAIVVWTSCWMGLMMTDILEGTDRIVLDNAWPVLVLGTGGLILVYGFLTPVLAGLWLTHPVAKESPRSRLRLSGKAAGYVLARWERLVKQGFLPYGLTLVVSIFVVVMLHSFVLVDDYGELATNGKDLSLEMVQGSSIDEAMRASQIAEERLRSLAEVRDLYTVASKERLSIHLKLADKYDWTMARVDLEKELDKRLRDIPGTDPFAFVASEDVKTRLEFTVKGPSLLTAQAIAQEVLTQLEKYTARDEDGQEIITDERIGTGTAKTIIEIRPKPDMLARYQVSEAEIKHQLESYLGEKSAGSVFWNEQSVPVVVRFPDNWMEYPEQVKNILIRTPEGKVHLGDLVSWKLGKEPPTYQREDGLYVFTVSSAVRDAGRIDSLAYVLPLRMQKTMIIPEGYSVLNADELKKLKEEQSDKADWGGRVLAVIAVITAVLLASLLLQRRTRDGIFALALLPVLAGGVMLGLLVMDRPMNGMAIYGMTGAIALLVQQALVLLEDLYAARAEESTIKDAVQAGTARAFASQAAVFGAVALASVPLTFGWVGEIDPFASFASTLFFGTLLAAFAVIALLPAMYYAAEWKQATKVEITLPIVLQRIYVWWENDRIRKQDAKERKQWLKQRREEQRKRRMDNDAPVKKDLTHQDFLPLSAPSNDLNR